MKLGSLLHGIGVASLVVLGLTGCGGPEGFLAPVPSDAHAPGTTHVEMVVATTRERVESPAFLFGGGRANDVSFADMVISIPPDAHRQIGEVQYPRQLPGNPETDFVTLKADVVTRSQAASAFSRMLRQSHKKEALVFVHGFNTRFEDAVYSFAQILHDSRAYDDVAPVLFTWPSKGKIVAYGYDRDSSTFSRDALENLLRHLADDPQVETISVLAHSMGNWVTLEALRQMAIRDGRVLPKIKLVMLADADVDVGIARQQILTLGPERPHIVLFVSETDRALAASRDFWEEPRLGAIDPDVEPYKTMLEQEQISAINMTHMPQHGFFGHGKFSSDPRVVELIGRSLASGQVLSASRVGLGSRIMMTTAGAVGSVGHAAGLVISAPVSIVDPETRNNFGDQIDQFNQSVRQIGANPY
ncbi:alpha/beta hydrolase [uncultured Rhodoblastus sp.]|uniref:alpha/beta hydrolase n=1 Tax=uncultured Rhodoblastus sp. TaxID=543037 RepID=UPI0025D635C2|nr:alpha/beta hydrolase [uncultured Rhodoblastus sp.]